MEIPAASIRTTEVQQWRGLHLLHYPMSSCSQKVRILMGEKGLDFTPHAIDLPGGQQRSDWFLGINPAGVVPVLVHDGRVYTESNDILAYLGEHFPSAAGDCLPTGEQESRLAGELLALENDLHADLRVITFTFVMPGVLMNHTFERGEVDAAVQRFDEVMRRLDARLSRSAFLCAERLTLPDIAWFITVHRLVLAGYPVDRLPRLAKWYRALLARPAFRREVSAGSVLPRVIGSVFRFVKRLRRATLRSRIPA